MKQQLGYYFFRLHRLQEIDSENENVYFNLAMLGMDSLQYNEAEKWLQKAIQVSCVRRSLGLCIY